MSRCLPHACRPGTRGFTLIEVMLALALGLLVSYVAFAAFTAASRTLVRAKELALRNQLLAAGVAYGLNEIDYWGACNDPDNPASGLLYLANPTFTDKNHSRPFNRLNHPTLAAGVQRFIADYRPDDLRWWYRYTLLCPPGQNAPVNLPDHTINDGKARAQPRPSDPPVNAYLHEAIEDIGFRLGHYAVLDYWPPGVPIGGADSSGLRSGWLGGGSSTNGTGGRMAGINPDYETWPVGPAFADRQGYHYVVAHCQFPGNTTVTSGNNRLTFNTFGSNNPFYNSIPVLRLLPQASANPLEVSAPQGPPGWPDLLVQVRRFNVRGQFFQQAAVLLRDTRSGETVHLRFSAPGSSLRGARISRGLDP